MNVYSFGNTLYCEDCYFEYVKIGAFTAGDFTGPFKNGGGEADYIKHCASGGACKNAIKTEFSKVGICLGNSLSASAVKHTLRALEDYINKGNGNPELLDVWARIVGDYCNSSHEESILELFDGIRDDEVTQRLKNNDLRNAYENSLARYRGETVAIGNTNQCKSCKGTGHVMLLNFTKECLDCKKEHSDIPF